MYTIHQDGVNIGYKVSGEFAAVLSMMHYLGKCIRVQLDKEPNDEAWIGHDDPDKAAPYNFTLCDQKKAQAILTQDKKIVLYAVSDKIGAFASADAEFVGAFQRDKKPDFETPPKTKEPEEKYLSPIEILEIAELQIFSYNLRCILNKRKFKNTDLDYHCSFASGTTDELLDGVMGLKPTEKMMSAICNVLNVQQRDLYYNAVADFKIHLKGSFESCPTSENQVSLR